MMEDGMTLEERAIYVADGPRPRLSREGILWKTIYQRALQIQREAVAEERTRCHNIALAIDSGRGNEKEIARAIARGSEDYG